MRTHRAACTPTLKPVGRHAQKRAAGGAWPGILGVGVLAVVVIVVVALLQPDPPDHTEGAAPTSPMQSREPAASSTMSPTPLPSPIPEPPPRVTIAFAGDVHFTGRTEALLADPVSAFGPIADTLSAADVAMVNLETAITERGEEAPKQFHFRAPPVALDALAAAGVDLASLANNHAVDYGPIGLADTLEAIEQGGFPVVGMGRDAASAYAPYRSDVRGVGISFFAVTQIPDHTFTAWTATDSSPGVASTADQARLIDGVRAATQAGDVTIVYVHWGLEGDACPTQEMAALVTDLVAAGADAIVGTHAHLLLGAGYHDEPGSKAYVAYGLGNFLWWRSRASSDDTGVLTLTVENGTVVDADFTPALIDDSGRPQPVLGPEAPLKLAAFEALRDCAGLLPAPVR